MLFRLGLLKKGGVLDLDFGHQFTPAGKHDAKYSYKRDYGYFPGILSFGGLLLGIENRDGNTNVWFHQEDTLKRLFERLVRDFGMVINRFRADCGSFSESIIRTVYDYCNTFYICAVNCESHRRDWKSVEINFERCEIVSFPFTAFMEDSHFHLVVQRTVGTWTSSSPTSSTHTDASSPTTGNPQKRISYATTMPEGKARGTSTYRTTTSDGHIRRSRSSL